MRTLRAPARLLRDALQAIEEGLPVDPARRPSDEEMLASLGERLAEVQRRNGAEDLPQR